MSTRRRRLSRLAQILSFNPLVRVVLNEHHGPNELDRILAGFNPSFGLC